MSMGPFHDGWTTDDVEAVMARGEPHELLYAPIVASLNAADCPPGWAESLCVRLAAHPALTMLVGGAVELHMFERGYCGVELQEGGRGNLCLAVRKSRLADYAGDPEALLAAWAADPRAWFKFVIARAEDVEEVLQLQEACAIPAERIYLMPEGRDSASLRSRAGWLAPLCLRHGFRLSDRLHIHLYGDERGT